MKYIKKIPTPDDKLRDELVLSGWRKVKEPSNINLAILLSMPFVFINCIISLSVIYFVYPQLREFLSVNSFSGEIRIEYTTLMLSVLGTLIFTTLHEFIHACFVPNILKSDKVYWGVNFLFGFVYTTEKIKKGRYLIISIMPFIVISIILPLVLGILGLLNGLIIFLCMLNAFGSSVDCLNMLIISMQVPNGAYIVSNGVETYFK